MTLVDFILAHAVYVGAFALLPLIGAWLMCDVFDWFD